jgi:hypothetical protein
MHHAWHMAHGAPGESNHINNTNTPTPTANSQHTKRQEEQRPWTVGNGQALALKRVIASSSLLKNGRLFVGVSR